MASKCSGGRELTQLVADHVLGDIDGHVLPAVVHGDGVADESAVEEMYRPYIEGKRELREINESYRANFVRGG